MCDYLGQYGFVRRFALLILHRNQFRVRYFDTATSSSGYEPQKRNVHLYDTLACVNDQRAQPTKGIDRPLTLADKSWRIFLTSGMVSVSKPPSNDQQEHVNQTWAHLAAILCCPPPPPPLPPFPPVPTPIRAESAAITAYKFVVLGRSTARASTQYHIAQERKYSNSRGITTTRCRPDGPLIYQ